MVFIIFATKHFNSSYGGKCFFSFGIAFIVSFLCKVINVLYNPDKEDHCQSEKWECSCHCECKFPSSKEANHERCNWEDKSHCESPYFFPYPIWEVNCMWCKGMNFMCFEPRNSLIEYSFEISFPKLKSLSNSSCHPARYLNKWKNKWDSSHIEIIFSKFPCDINKCLTRDRRTYKIFIIIASLPNSSVIYPRTNEKNGVAQPLRMAPIVPKNISHLSSVYEYLKSWKKCINYINNNK